MFMSKNEEALLKAVAIAKIKLSSHEKERLVSEIDEVLKVFSKIDKLKFSVPLPVTIKERKLRRDKVEKSSIDPFSNSKLVRDRKFIGPKLVD